MLVGNVGRVSALSAMFSLQTAEDKHEADAQPVVKHASAPHSTQVWQLL